MTKRTQCPECYFFDVVDGKCQSCPYTATAAKTEAKPKKAGK